MQEPKAVRPSPLVSVIMPTYNHGEFIGDSIESVLCQTFGDWELIVVDNASTDQTEAIVAAHCRNDARIRHLKFRNHGIIAASRNYGIAGARGDFIAFLDSDDVWRRTKLERQLKHFANDEIVGVGTDAVLLSNTPYCRQMSWGGSKAGYVDYDYSRILNANPIMTSSVVVRKDELLDVGGFDENPDFRFIEDWELWLRMARLGEFRILGARLLEYRVFSAKGRDRIDVSRRLFKVLDKHLALGYVTIRDTREPGARINLSLANNLLDLSDRSCRRYYAKAFRNSSSMKIKAKALMGYFLSILPRVLRQGVRFILYSMGRAVSGGIDQYRRIRAR